MFGLKAPIHHDLDAGRSGRTVAHFHHGWWIASMGTYVASSLRCYKLTGIPPLSSAQLTIRRRSTARRDQVCEWRLRV